MFCVCERSLTPFRMTAHFANIVALDTLSRAAISRPSPTRPRRRSAAHRSHRYWHVVDLRRASALRFASERPGVPVADDEKAPHQIAYLRAALVFARRHERQVSERARRHDLGRLGRRTRKSRAGLRFGMAGLARPKWRAGCADRK